MTKILDHLEQPDSSTCQAAAIAKVLGTQDVMAIRNELLAGGVAGDPQNMGRLMKREVSKGNLKFYEYQGAATLKNLEDWVTQGKGYEAIIHGFFTPGGHVIGVEDAYPANRFFRVDDPWYEFDFPSARFTKLSGKNKEYSYLGIYSYCCASWSFREAQELYASRQVVMSNPGLWMHKIRN
jgi:hypothetical protein